MNWLDEVQNEKQPSHNILSFEEYMEVFEKSPLIHSRTTAHYFKDMFDYFGENDQGGFNLFTQKYEDSPAIYGQYKTQREIYNNLKNFIEEGFNNKFLLLLGPNGSSKSSIIKKMMKAAEVYSSTDEGMLNTFSWIFPIEATTKGSLVLGKNQSHAKIPSYASLEDKDISAILNSELKDHPILLIPKKTRRKLLDKLFSDSPHKYYDLKKTYLYNGELSKRNQMVFDALLANYNYNYSEVYKHIRVERFKINKKQSTASVTIEPQMHVDANMQQISMDKRLTSLPPSLQSLNLFSVNGEVILGNRGMIEFSDLLKRPVDAFKYLLMTMETKSINLHGVLTELDSLFLGTSNELHFSNFKQNPDYKSFKGRFNIIKVPYLLNYQQESKIYQEQIKNLTSYSEFAPHALEALTLWAVMTRFRAPEAEHYHDNKIGEIAASLSPLEKAHLYADKKIPERLELEAQKSLKRDIDIIFREYSNVIPYEGMFGVSPREMKKILYKLAERNQVITFIEVLDLLRQLQLKKVAYDFLNINPIRDFHDSNKFIMAIEEYLLNVFDSELRDALGLIDDRSYEDYIEKYVLNVKSLLTNEKIKNPTTQQFEHSDENFIKEFEKKINITSEINDFRSDTLSKLGAYAIDHPGEDFKYTFVFSDLSKALKESFRKEQKQTIQKISEGLIYYLEEKEHSSNELINRVINNLKNHYGYSKKSSLELIQFLLTKRYN